MSDAIVAAVGDEQVTTAVYCHSIWIRQTRARGGPPVAFEDRIPIAHHRRDDSPRIHFTDAVIFPFSNIHVAAAVHRHSHWKIKTRARGVPPVAAEALHAIPRHRCDDPRARV